MKFLSNLYLRTYNRICGTHPNVYLWHSQWLATKDLNASLRGSLPEFTGRILDVGCGNKPYQHWTHAVEYVGIDVYPGPGVDAIIEADTPWPLQPSSFDGVLCTQVLEHAANLDQTLAEIGRVLKPGGLLIVTVPFAYNQHGAPDDYRRLTIFGVRALFKEHYEIRELREMGGIGSTLGIFFLNWVNTYKPLRPVVALLPLWMFISLVVNCMGWLFDRIDNTQSYYSNVFMLAVKR